LRGTASIWVVNTSGQNVFVTGGNGFIGTALARFLGLKYQGWVSFDNLLPQVHQSMPPQVGLPRNFEFVQGDVSDYQELKRALKEVNPDILIHLAAETGTGQSLYESRKHVLVNELGTANLIDALTELQIKPTRIILASSRAVYGEGLWTSNERLYYPDIRSKTMLEKQMWDFPNSLPLPMSHLSTRPNPVSVYGATKLSQENLLKAWCASNDVQLSILRLQNVYGPGQAPGNSYTGIVTLFINLARAGKVIPVYEDGKIVRDFVYISDVVEAFEKALAAEQGPISIFDIGSGQRTTVLELAQLISEIFQSNRPSITNQFRFGDVRAAWADIAPTLESLGWKPKIDLQAGVSELVNWIENLAVVDESKTI
jgi:dTDP-L-rhamnose 4-epimerase